MPINSFKNSINMISKITNFFLGDFGATASCPSIHILYLTCFRSIREHLSRQQSFSRERLTPIALFSTFRLRDYRYTQNLIQ